MGRRRRGSSSGATAFVRVSLQVLYNHLSHSSSVAHDCSRESERERKREKQQNVRIAKLSGTKLTLKDPTRSGRLHPPYTLAGSFEVVAAAAAAGFEVEEEEETGTDLRTSGGGPIRTPCTPAGMSACAKRVTISLST